MLKSTDTTLKLLLGISSRLASRDDCRHVEYRVTIQNGTPTMDPAIYVFPTRYRRKESDKISVLEFISNDLVGKGYDLTLLVDGTYVYKNSIEKRQRRWIHDAESLY